MKSCILSKFDKIKDVSSETYYLTVEIDIQFKNPQRLWY